MRPDLARPRPTLALSVDFGCAADFVGLAAIRADRVKASGVDCATMVGIGHRVRALHARFGAKRRVQLQDGHGRSPYGQGLLFSGGAVDHTSPERVDRLAPLLAMSNQAKVHVSCQTPLFRFHRKTPTRIGDPSNGEGPRKPFVLPASATAWRDRHSARSLRGCWGGCGHVGRRMTVCAGA